MRNSRATVARTKKNGRTDEIEAVGNRFTPPSKLPFPISNETSQMEAFSDIIMKFDTTTMHD